MIALPSIDSVPRIELVGGDAVLRWGDEVIRIPRLKHGVLFLMSGYIGSQIHGCEYRLHLDYMRGRIINKRVVSGLIEHARQLNVDEEGLGLELGWNPVLVNRGEEGVYFFNEKMKNWIGKADLSKPYVQEASLLMTHRNVPILGLPDLIINIDGRPTYIVELKTTESPRRVKSVAGREILQAESYFHMLSYLGFNPRGAAVLKVVRGSSFRLIDELDLIIRHFEESEEGSMRVIRSNVAMHRVRIRSFGEFMKDVDYALDYWLGIRNPTPRPSRGLCRFCEHRRDCPYSVVK